ncbi:MAG: lysophospholipid acyltransferase family protein, partial [Calditrichota bacterium]
MRLGYAFVRAFAQMLFRLGYGISVTGTDNIPRTGSLIIASNHRSNFDPPLMGSIIPREAHFFAKDELFRSRLFGGFLRYLNAFPVRRGKFDRESLKTCLGVLENNGALVFFPEGTRAPSDGFLRAKIGLGWVISLSNAPILPVYLHGTADFHPRIIKRPGFSVVFGNPIPAAD